VRARELIFTAAHPLFLAPNDVLMFVIFLPLIIWYGSFLKNGWRIFFIAVYLSLLIALSELLLSRTALLVIAVTLFFPILSRRRWQVFPPILLIAIGAISGLVYFDHALLEKIRSHDLDRLRLWVIAWHMFMDAPLLGHGPGSFTALYNQYMDQLSTALNFGRDIRHMGWAHNLFMEAAAEKGIIGLAAVMIYFLYLLVAITRKLKVDRNDLYVALRRAAALLLLMALTELSLLRVWAIYVMYLLLGLTASFLRESDSV
jgi:O-antigen ligase